jgi:hypothetical protein
MVLGQCLRIVLETYLATKTTSMRIWQKIIASWLNVAQDDIGAGLQDEKHDGEDRPFVEHVD